MQKIVLIISVLVITLTGCTPKNTDTTSEFTIYTTIYALESTIETLVGDQAEVISVYPVGADTHQYELTSKQIQDINNADMFIYMDKRYEPFVTDLLPNINDQVTVIEVNTMPTFLAQVNPQDLNTEGLVIDYHTMLYPVYTSIIAESLSAEIIKLLPQSETIITDNLTKYQAELNTLNESWLALPDLQIFVTHDAYYYWEQYYGITVTGIHNGSHDDEPTAQDIQNIIDQMNTNQIQYLYVEDNEEHNDIADQIIAATNAEQLALNNIEAPTENITTMTYIEVMSYNLEQIQKSVK